MTKEKIAIIGAGVIGGGWCARFLLMGHDVFVYDPNPNTANIIDEILYNARLAYGKLTNAPLPKEGKLIICVDMNQAVSHADFIQESVPERIDIKQQTYKDIEKYANHHVAIASSTSGFKPSDLQDKMQNPERLIVAHPYNPVYLLPLVELVAGEKTNHRYMTHAQQLYQQLAMKPVIIKKEIEAFVGDRLLEAVWREALWLIHDDITTTEECDDIMRYSFGLRWAQMGLFQTYTLAGGKAGMRHFLAQFGDALQLPWTKLTNVPDLDSNLIEKIATQCDIQSGEYSIRELEKIRDDNLIAIMQALKLADNGHGWGAGKSLQQLENMLYQQQKNSTDNQQSDITAPLHFITVAVNPSWVDYNGHMNESRYLQIFGDCTDGLLHFIGAGLDYVASGYSFYTVETHLRHLKEARLGDVLHGKTQLLEYDEKRIHLFHQLYNNQHDIIATAEMLILHVDQECGKACPANRYIQETLAKIYTTHQKMEKPIAVGQSISLRKKGK